MRFKPLKCDDLGLLPATKKKLRCSAVQVGRSSARPLSNSRDGNCVRAGFCLRFYTGWLPAEGPASRLQPAADMCRLSFLAGAASTFPT